MAPSNPVKPLNGKNSQPSSNKIASKDKIGKDGKVNSSKTPKKAEQKREVRENIQKLQLVLDNSRVQHEAHKQTLEELTKAYDNGAHPEHKDEYERKTKELNDMTTILETYEADLNQLRAEQKGLDGVEGMEGVEETSGSSNLGPDLPSHDDLDSAPLIKVTDEGGMPKSTDNEDDEDAGLFTPEKNKVVTGRSDDGIVVAWRKQGYSKQVIIRYGPKNSPKYERSTKFKAGIPFDENTTVEIGPDYRFGDEKRDKKFVRQWDDFKGILGVAYNCSLEELIPRKTSGKKKYPRVDVWVKWSINGEIHRTWEVPSSIKHIWPNPTQCEEYIYNAACEHQEKHQAWLGGQREGKEASPSPGPETRRLMPTGPQVPKEKIKVENSGSNGTSSPKPILSNEESMFQFRSQWAMMTGLDPKNLTMKQQMTFLKAWNEMNAEEEL